MTKHVLSMAGGGIFGYQEALVLTEIEAQTGRRSADLFDLIAGTSTGGIIACGLAIGLPASDMAALYRDHGPEIFRHSFTQQLSDFDGLAGPKYSATPLTAYLRATLGDKTLFDAKTHLLVPTTQCVPEASPYWFRSWQGPNFPLWQIARATSAAPYYFPPAEIMALDGARMTCADGGLWANNPEDHAALEAAALWPREKISILSLGTGSASIIVAAKADWGGVDWAPHLLDLLMACTESAAAERVALLGIDRIHLDSDLTGDMDDVSQTNMAAMEKAAAEIIAGPEFAAAIERLAP